MMKRTVGRRLKLAFNVDDILAAMTRICGDPKETWRAVNGFWGKLATELGLKNKILVRKNLNTRWIEDRSVKSYLPLQNYNLIIQFPSHTLT